MSSEQLAAERGAVVNPLIAAAWDRCLNVYGLEPEAPGHRTVIQRERMRDSIEKLGSLFSLCQSQTRQIFTSINNTGHTVVLTDDQGVILDFAVVNLLEDAYSKCGLVRGADWSEKCEGANGVGTALHEKRSVIIHRNQHFRLAHEALTCTAAPVFDENGDVLAVFDVSSVGRDDDPDIIAHTRAMLEMSARLISRRHFNNVFSDSWIVRFHGDPERIGLLEEGLLAVDESGEILAADNQALSLLNIRDRDQLVSRKLDDIFGRNFSGLIDMQNSHDLARSETGSLTTSSNGQQPASLYAKLVKPEPKLKPSQTGSGRSSTRNKVFSLQALAGNDRHMQDMLGKARKLVNHDIPLLITGETGTGKEVFARALHNASSRAGKPFIAINCAAMPASLIEGELFGYRSGAFTGAHPAGFKGRFAQANGGAIFLDEISDMPLEIQTRLLRVLEERAVTPLGSEKSIDLDLQVISAANQDLNILRNEGAFRQDLYYRLAGFEFHLPRLSERNDMEHVIASIFPGLNLGSNHSFTPAARKAIRLHAWPGNIRELKNVLTRATVLSGSAPIDVDHLGLTVEESVQPEKPLDTSEFEKNAILKTLEQCRWNVTRTAEALGVSRNTLYRKIRRMGISLKR